MCRRICEVITDASITYARYIIHSFPYRKMFADSSAYRFQKSLKYLVLLSKFICNSTTPDEQARITTGTSSNALHPIRPYDNGI